MFDARLFWRLTETIVRNGDPIIDNGDDDLRSSRDRALRNSRFQEVVGVDEFEARGRLLGPERKPGVSDLQASRNDETSKGVVSCRHRRDEKIDTQHPVHLFIVLAAV